MSTCKTTNPKGPVQDEFWRNIINKYEERNANLECELQHLQHRVNQMDASVPAVMTYNMAKLAKDRPNADISEIISTTTTCDCGSDNNPPTTPLKLPDMSNMSVFSIESADICYMDKIKQLTEREKKLIEDVNALKAKDKALKDVQKKVEQFSDSKEGEGVTVRGVDLGGMSETLMKENQRMHDELADCKLELKHLRENIEGPLQRELERERRANAALELDLRRKDKECEDKHATTIRETALLKMQLEANESNLKDLKEINDKFKDEIGFIIKRNEQLQADLINQKLSEATTIALMKTELERKKKKSSSRSSFCTCRDSDSSGGDSRGGKRRPASAKKSDETPEMTSRIPSNSEITATQPPQLAPDATIEEEAVVEKDVQSPKAITPVASVQKSETKTSSKIIIPEVVVVQEEVVEQAEKETDVKPETKDTANACTCSMQEVPVKGPRQDYPCRIPSGDDLYNIARDLSNEIQAAKEDHTVPETLLETVSNIKELCDLIDQKCICSSPAAKGEKVTEYETPKTGSAEIESAKKSSSVTKTSEEEISGNEGSKKESSEKERSDKESSEKERSEKESSEKERTEKESSEKETSEKEESNNSECFCDWAGQCESTSHTTAEAISDMKAPPTNADIDTDNTYVTSCLSKTYACAPGIMSTHADGENVTTTVVTPGNIEVVTQGKDGTISTSMTVNEDTGNIEVVTDIRAAEKDTQPNVVIEDYKSDKDDKDSNGRGSTSKLGSKTAVECKSSKCPLSCPPDDTCDKIESEPPASNEAAGDFIEVQETTSKYNDVKRVTSYLSELGIAIPPEFTNERSVTVAYVFNDDLMQNDTTNEADNEPSQLSNTLNDWTVSYSQDTPTGNAESLQFGTTSDSITEIIFVDDCGVGTSDDARPDQTAMRFSSCTFDKLAVIPEVDERLNPAIGSLNNVPVTILGGRNLRQDATQVLTTPTALVPYCPYHSLSTISQNNRTFSGNEGESVVVNNILLRRMSNADNPLSDLSVLPPITTSRIAACPYHDHGKTSQKEGTDKMKSIPSLLSHLVKLRSTPFPPQDHLVLPMLPNQKTTQDQGMADARNSREVRFDVNQQCNSAAFSPKGPTSSSHYSNVSEYQSCINPDEHTPSIPPTNTYATDSSFGSSLPASHFNSTANCSCISSAIPPRAINNGEFLNDAHGSDSQHIGRYPNPRTNLPEAKYVTSVVNPRANTRYSMERHSHTRLVTALPEDNLPAFQQVPLPPTEKLRLSSFNSAKSNNILSDHKARYATKSMYETSTDFPDSSQLVVVPPSVVYTMEEARGINLGQFPKQPNPQGVSNATAQIRSCGANRTPPNQQQQQQLNTPNFGQRNIAGNTQQMQQARNQNMYQPPISNTKCSGYSKTNSPVDSHKQVQPRETHPMETQVVGQGRDGSICHSSCTATCSKSSKHTTDKPLDNRRSSCSRTCTGSCVDSQLQTLEADHGYDGMPQSISAYDKKPAQVEDEYVPDELKPNLNCATDKRDACLATCQAMCAKASSNLPSVTQSKCSTKCSAPCSINQGQGLPLKQLTPTATVEPKEEPKSFTCRPDCGAACAKRNLEVREEKAKTTGTTGTVCAQTCTGVCSKGDIGQQESQNKQKEVSRELCSTSCVGPCASNATDYATNHPNVNNHISCLSTCTGNCSIGRSNTGIIIAEHLTDHQVQTKPETHEQGCGQESNKDKRNEVAPKQTIQPTQQTNKQTVPDCPPECRGVCSRSNLTQGAPAKPEKQKNKCLADCAGSCSKNQGDTNLPMPEKINNNGQPIENTATQCLPTCTGTCNTDHSGKDAAPQDNATLVKPSTVCAVTCTGICSKLDFTDNPPQAGDTTKVCMPSCTGPCAINSELQAVNNKIDFCTEQENLGNTQKGSLIGKSTGDCLPPNAALENKTGIETCAPECTGLCSKGIVGTVDNRQDVNQTVVKPCSPECTGLCAKRNEDLHANLLESGVQVNPVMQTHGCGENATDDGIPGNETVQGKQKARVCSPICVGLCSKAATVDGEVDEQTSGQPCAPKCTGTCAKNAAGDLQVENQTSVEPCSSKCTGPCAKNIATNLELENQSATEPCSPKCTGPCAKTAAGDLESENQKSAEPCSPKCTGPCAKGVAANLELEKESASEPCSPKCTGPCAKNAAGDLQSENQTSVEPCSSKCTGPCAKNIATNLELEKQSATEPCSPKCTGPCAKNAAGDLELKNQNAVEPCSPKCTGPCAKKVATNLELEKESATEPCSPKCTGPCAQNAAGDLESDNQKSAEPCSPKCTGTCAKSIAVDLELDNQSTTKPCSPKCTGTCATNVGDDLQLENQTTCAKNAAGDLQQEDQTAVKPCSSKCTGPCAKDVATNLQVEYQSSTQSCSPKCTGPCAQNAGGDLQLEDQSSAKPCNPKCTGPCAKDVAIDTQFENETTTKPCNPICTGPCAKNIATDLDLEKQTKAKPCASKCTGICSDKAQGMQENQSTLQPCASDTQDNTKPTTNCLDDEIQVNLDTKQHSCAQDFSNQKTSKGSLAHTNSEAKKQPCGKSTSIDIQAEEKDLQKPCATSCTGICSKDAQKSTETNLKVCASKCTGICSGNEKSTELTTNEDVKIQTCASKCTGVCSKVEILEETNKSKEKCAATCTGVCSKTQLAEILTDIQNCNLDALQSHDKLKPCASKCTGVCSPKEPEKLTENITVQTCASKCTGICSKTKLAPKIVESEEHLCVIKCTAACSKSNEISRPPSKQESVRRKSVTIDEPSKVDCANDAVTIPQDAPIQTSVANDPIVALPPSKTCEGDVETKSKKSSHSDFPCNSKEDLFTKPGGDKSSGKSLPPTKVIENLDKNSLPSTKVSENLDKNQTRGSKECESNCIADCSKSDKRKGKKSQPQKFLNKDLENIQNYNVNEVVDNAFKPKNSDKFNIVADQACDPVWNNASTRTQTGQSTEEIDPKFKSLVPYNLSKYINIEKNSIFSSTSNLVKTLIVNTVSKEENAVPYCDKCCAAVWNEGNARTQTNTSNNTKQSPPRRVSMNLGVNTSTHEHLPEEVNESAELDEKTANSGISSGAPKGLADNLLTNQLDDKNTAMYATGVVGPTQFIPGGLDQLFGPMMQNMQTEMKESFMSFESHSITTGPDGVTHHLTTGKLEEMQLDLMIPHPDGAQNNKGDKNSKIAESKSVGRPPSRCSCSANDDISQNANCNCAKMPVVINIQYSGNDAHKGTTSCDSELSTSEKRHEDCDCPDIFALLDKVKQEFKVSQQLLWEELMQGKPSSSSVEIPSRVGNKTRTNAVAKKVPNEPAATKRIIASEAKPKNPKNATPLSEAASTKDTSVQGKDYSQLTGGTSSPRSRGSRSPKRNSKFDISPNRSGLPPAVETKRIANPKNINCNCAGAGKSSTAPNCTCCKCIIENVQKHAARQLDLDKDFKGDGDSVQSGNNIEHSVNCTCVDCLYKHPHRKLEEEPSVRINDIAKMKCTCRQRGICDKCKAISNALRCKLHKEVTSSKNSKEPSPSSSIHHYSKKSHKGGSSGKNTPQKAVEQTKTANNVVPPPTNQIASSGLPPKPIENDTNYLFKAPACPESTSGYNCLLENIPCDCMKDPKDPKDLIETGTYTEFVPNYDVCRPTCVRLQENKTTCSCITDQIIAMQAAKEQEIDRNNLKMEICTKCCGTSFHTKEASIGQSKEKVYSNLASTDAASQINKPKVDDTYTQHIESVPGSYNQQKTELNSFIPQVPLPVSAPYDYTKQTKESNIVGADPGIPPILNYNQSPDGVCALTCSKFQSVPSTVPDVAKNKQSPDGLCAWTCSKFQSPDYTGVNDPTVNPTIPREPNNKQSPDGLCAITCSKFQSPGYTGVNDPSVNPSIPREPNNKQSPDGLCAWTCSKFQSPDCTGINDPSVKPTIPRDPKHKQSPDGLCAITCSKFQSGNYTGVNDPTVNPTFPREPNNKQSPDGLCAITCSKFLSPDYTGINDPSVNPTIPREPHTKQSPDGLCASTCRKFLPQSSGATGQTSSMPNEYQSYGGEQIVPNLYDQQTVDYELINSYNNGTTSREQCFKCCGRGLTPQELCVHCCCQTPSRFDQTAVSSYPGTGASSAKERMPLDKYGGSNLDPVMDEEIFYDALSNKGQVIGTSLDEAGEKCHKCCMINLCAAVDKKVAAQMPTIPSARTDNAITTESKLVPLQAIVHDYTTVVFLAENTGTSNAVMDDYITDVLQNTKVPLGEIVDDEGRLMFEISKPTQSTHSITSKINQIVSIEKEEHLPFTTIDTVSGPVVLVPKDETFENISSLLNDILMNLGIFDLPLTADYAEMNEEFQNACDICPVCTHIDTLTNMEKLMEAFDVRKLPFQVIRLTPTEIIVLECKDAVEKSTTVEIVKGFLQCADDDEINFMDVETANGRKCFVQAAQSHDNERIAHNVELLIAEVPKDKLPFDVVKMQDGTSVALVGYVQSDVPITDYLDNLLKENEIYEKLTSPGGSTYIASASGTWQKELTTPSGHSKLVPVDEAEQQRILSEGVSYTKSGRSEGFEEDDEVKRACKICPVCCDQAQQASRITTPGGSTYVTSPGGTLQKEVLSPSGRSVLVPVDDAEKQKILSQVASERTAEGIPSRITTPGGSTYVTSPGGTLQKEVLSPSGRSVLVPVDDAEKQKILSQVASERTAEGIPSRITTPGGSTYVTSPGGTLRKEVLSPSGRSVLVPVDDAEKQKILSEGVSHTKSERSEDFEEEDELKKACKICPVCYDQEQQASRITTPGGSTYVTSPGGTLQKEIVTASGHSIFVPVDDAEKQKILSQVASERTAEGIPSRITTPGGSTYVTSPGGTLQKEILSPSGRSILVPVDDAEKQKILSQVASQRTAEGIPSRITTPGGSTYVTSPGGTLKKEVLSPSGRSVLVPVDEAEQQRILSEAASHRTAEGIPSKFASPGGSTYVTSPGGTLQKEVLSPSGRSVLVPVEDAEKQRILSQVPSFKEGIPSRITTPGGSTYVTSPGGTMKKEVLSPSGRSILVPVDDAEKQKVLSQVPSKITTPGGSTYVTSPGGTLKKEILSPSGRSILVPVDDAEKQKVLSQVPSHKGAPSKITTPGGSTYVTSPGGTMKKEILSPSGRSILVPVDDAEKQKVLSQVPSKVTTPGGSTYVTSPGGTMKKEILSPSGRSVLVPVDDAEKHRVMSQVPSHKTAQGVPSKITTPGGSIYVTSPGGTLKKEILSPSGRSILVPVDDAEKQRVLSHVPSKFTSPGGSTYVASPGGTLQKEVRSPSGRLVLAPVDAAEKQRILSQVPSYKDGVPSKITTPGGSIYVTSPGGTLKKEILSPSGRSVLVAVDDAEKQRVLSQVPSHKTTEGVPSRITTPGGSTYVTSPGGTMQKEILSPSGRSVLVPVDDAEKQKVLSQVPSKYTSPGGSIYVTSPGGTMKKELVTASGHSILVPVDDEEKQRILSQVASEQSKSKASRITTPGGTSYVTSPGGTMQKEFMTPSGHTILLPVDDEEKAKIMEMCPPLSSCKCDACVGTEHMLAALEGLQSFVPFETIPVFLGEIILVPGENPDDIHATIKALKNLLQNARNEDIPMRSIKTAAKERVFVPAGKSPSKTEISQFFNDNLKKVAIEDLPCDKIKTTDSIYAIFLPLNGNLLDDDLEEYLKAKLTEAFESALEYSIFDNLADQMVVSEFGDNQSLEETAETQRKLAGVSADKDDIQSKGTGDIPLLNTVCDKCCKVRLGPEHASLLRAYVDHLLLQEAQKPNGLLNNIDKDALLRNTQNLEKFKQLVEYDPEQPLAYAAEEPCLQEGNLDAITEIILRQTQFLPINYEDKYKLEEQLQATILEKGEFTGDSECHDKVCKKMVGEMFPQPTNDITDTTGEHDICDTCCKQRLGPQHAALLRAYIDFIILKNADSPEGILNAIDKDALIRNKQNVEAFQLLVKPEPGQPLTYGADESCLRQCHLDNITDMILRQTQYLPISYADKYKLEEQLIAMIKEIGEFTGDSECHEKVCGKMLAQMGLQADTTEEETEDDEEEGSEICDTCCKQRLGPQHAGLLRAYIDFMLLREARTPGSLLHAIDPEALIRNKENLEGFKQLVEFDPDQPLAFAAEEPCLRKSHIEIITDMILRETQYLPISFADKYKLQEQLIQTIVLKGEFTGGAKCHNKVCKQMMADIFSTTLTDDLYGNEDQNEEEESVCDICDPCLEKAVVCHPEDVAQAPTTPPNSPETEGYDINPIVSQKTSQPSVESPRKSKDMSTNTKDVESVPKAVTSEESNYQDAVSSLRKADVDDKTATKTNKSKRNFILCDKYKQEAPQVIPSKQVSSKACECDLDKLLRMVEMAKLRSDPAKKPRPKSSSKIPEKGQTLCECKEEKGSSPPIDKTGWVCNCTGGCKCLKCAFIRPEDKSQMECSCEGKCLCPKCDFKVSHTSRKDDDDDKRKKDRDGDSGSRSRDDSRGRRRSKDESNGSRRRSPKGDSRKPKDKPRKPESLDRENNGSASQPSENPKSTDSPKKSHDSSVNSSVASASDKNKPSDIKSNRGCASCDNLSCRLDREERQHSSHKGSKQPSISASETFDHKDSRVSTKSADKKSTASQQASRSGKTSDRPSKESVHVVDSVRTEQSHESFHTTSSQIPGLDHGPKQVLDDDDTDGTRKDKHSMKSDRSHASSDRRTSQKPSRRSSHDIGAFALEQSEKQSERSGPQLGISKETSRRSSRLQQEDNLEKTGSQDHPSRTRSDGGHSRTSSHGGHGGLSEHEGHSRAGSHGISSSDRHSRTSSYDRHSRKGSHDGHDDRDGTTDHGHSRTSSHDRHSRTSDQDRHSRASSYDRHSHISSHDVQGHISDHEGHSATNSHARHSRTSSHDLHSHTSDQDRHSRTSRDDRHSGISSHDRHSRTSDHERHSRTSSHGSHSATRSETREAHSRTSSKHSEHVGSKGRASYTEAVSHTGSERTDMTTESYHTAKTDLNEEDEKISDTSSRQREKDDAVLQESLIREHVEEEQDVEINCKDICKACSSEQDGQDDGQQDHSVELPVEIHSSEQSGQDDAQKEHTVEQQVEISRSEETGQDEAQPEPSLDHQLETSISEQTGRDEAQQEPSVEHQVELSISEQTGQDDRQQKHSVEHLVETGSSEQIGQDEAHHEPSVDHQVPTGSSEQTGQDDIQQEPSPEDQLEITRSEQTGQDDTQQEPSPEDQLEITRSEQTGQDDTQHEPSVDHQVEISTSEQGGQDDAQQKHSVEHLPEESTPEQTGPDEAQHPVEMSSSEQIGHAKSDEESIYSDRGDQPVDETKKDSEVAISEILSEKHKQECLTACIAICKPCHSSDKPPVLPDPDISGINDDINELQKIMRGIKCNCTRAELVTGPLLEKKGSPFAPTLSALQLALETFEQKCHTKDLMIHALKKELEASGPIDYKNKFQSVTSSPDYDRVTLHDKLLKPLCLDGVEVFNQPPFCACNSQNVSSGCTCQNDQTPFVVTDVRRIGVNSILLKWGSPLRGDIVGFEIFINGALKSRIFSPRRRTAIIDTVDLTVNLEIKLYAIGLAGTYPAAVAHYNL